jgi:hypothetical protein
LRLLIDQRKHLRRSLRSEVWLGQDGIFTRTHELLRDLSEGGAFVETSQQFAIGSILNLQFTLPGVRRPISATVSVRNLRGGSGLGVQFLDLSPEDQRVVSAFLAAKPGSETLIYAQ